MSIGKGPDTSGAFSDEQPFMDRDECEHHCELCHISGICCSNCPQCKLVDPLLDPENIEDLVGGVGVAPECELCSRLGLR